jgi:hypothetical protein
MRFRKKGRREIANDATKTSSFFSSERDSNISLCGVWRNRKFGSTSSCSGIGKSFWIDIGVPSSYEETPLKSGVPSGDRAQCRVARWNIFKPEILIWVNFGGTCNRSGWYIPWPFGQFYGHLVNFMVIWYTLPSFGVLYQEKSGNPGPTDDRGYFREPRTRG